MFGIIVVAIIFAMTAGYGFLSGGLGEARYYMILFLPLGFAGLVLAYWCGRFNHPYEKKYKWGNKIFWVGMVYYFLPAIMNGLSVLMGNSLLGNFIFEMRFNVMAWPLALAYAIIVTHGIAYEVIMSLLVGRRRKQPITP